MADNSNLIEIDIVLSDGTIQKAQLNLQKALEKAGKDGGKSVEDSLSAVGNQIVNKFDGNFRNIFGVSLPKNLLLATASIGAVGLAIKEAFDFTLAGEKLALIENAFDLLSSKAGISGEALKSALSEASGGFLTQSEILQSANKALVELGSNASKIPEIMSLARQATLVFGGDIASNFDILNRAIASGQTRALRQVGIMIDGNKAVNDYARSLGVAAGSLTETGRQQAILEAVLTKGNEAYKGVSEAVTPVTNEYKKLGVALDELIDKSEKAASSSFGGVFQRLTSGFADMANNFGSFIARISGTETAQDKIKRLSDDYKYLQFQINSPVTDKAMLPTLQKQLEIVQTELSKASKSVQGFNSRVTGDSSGTGTLDKGKAVDSKQDALAKDKLNQQINQARDGALAIEEARAQAMNDGTEKEVALADLRNQRLAALKNDFALKEKEFQDNNAITKQFSTTQEHQILEDMEREHQDRILQIQDEAVAKEKQNLAQLDSALKSALANTMSQSIQKFVAAAIKGQNAFKAMVGAIIAGLGDMAINIGQMMILQGITIEAAKVLGGGQMIAAGAALVALGSVAKAYSGGGDTGGGVTNSGTTDGQAGAPNNQAKAQPGTNVTVQIQGNVFDRKETGMQIAETLNEYFNSSDGRITKAAFA